MGEEHYSEIYPGYPETHISKPPRPWSADIVTFNKRMQGAPEVPEYRTTRSETSHEKTSGKFTFTLSAIILILHLFD